MKRFITKFLYVVTLLSSFVLFSCNNNSSESLNNSISTHEHTYSNSYEYDDTYHWHPSTCDHDIQGDKERHTFTTSVTDPTYESGGYTTYTCSTCGYFYTDDETGKLLHNYSSEWSHDEKSHWHACTDYGYESLRIDETNHTFTSIVTDPTYETGGYTTYTCSVCGYFYTDDETSALPITIIWKNYDGTILEVDNNVPYGSIPSYDGETPIKESDSNYDYSFTGWDPDVLEATEDRTYIAQYISIPATHTVRFDVGDYGLISDNIFTVEPGDSVSEPSVNYTDVPGTMVLTGWYLEETLKTPVTFPYVPTTDITLYGKWEEITDVSKYLTYYYDESNEGYVVKGYNEVYSLKTIRIPDCFDDGINGKHPIVGIQHAFSRNKNIETIIFPETLQIISEGAFNECYSLTKVDFSESLKEIGESAFYLCESLTSIVLPDGLQTIGEEAFRHCTSLKSIVLPDSLQTIGESAFSNCASLKSIILPDNLQTIGDRTFLGCDSLESIILPDNLQTIGESAFEYCGLSLESIVLPDSLQTIGESAFSHCASLKSIILPDNLQTIGDRTFQWCSSLESIILPDNLQTIGESAFYWCTSLKSVILPDNLQTIGRGTFQWCSSLESIILPDNLQTIGDYAFERCRSLESIVLPDGLQTIGEEAFSDCASLKSIILPDNLQTIGEKVFRGCSSLTAIYCLSTSMPSGWNPNFNCDAPVYWYSETNPGSAPGNYWHYNENGDPWKW